MTEITANNKRIAKNTFMLYIRMFVMLVVSLYTSRIVLDSLGEKDYGIYNVIGGVVVFFSFINVALLQATQRFLNFELGKKDMSAAHNIFCMSMNSYIILSVLFFVAAESIGLWFVNSQLKIPEERMYAANWVYQFSIMTFIINLIRIPYNATIIAYEKMNFFAYISIIEAVLKLLVVNFIIICSFDKLIFFAALYTIIPLIISISYKEYCNKCFDVTRYKYYWDLATIKKLFSFSSWSLLGSIANMLASQGLVILVNLFHGVAANAAMGLANQISAKVVQFFSNFQMAFNPQIVKRYAAGETESMYKLIFSASKISYYIMLIVSLPLIIEMDMMLSLWLVDVPQFTMEFTQLILVFMLIEALAAPLWMFVQATGQIKNYQILMGILVFFNFPLAYFVLKIGLPVYSVWIVRILVNIVVCIVRCFYLQHIFAFPFYSYIVKVLLPVLVVTLLIIPPPLFTHSYFDSKWLELVSTITISVLTSLVVVFFVGLNNREKSLLVTGIKNKLHL